MSSILKALKKLENDLPEARVLNPWHRKVEMRPTFAGTARGLALRNRIFYLLLTAPLLLFGGWLFFKYGMVPTTKFFPYKVIRPPVEIPVKSQLVEIK